MSIRNKNLGYADWGSAQSGCWEIFRLGGTEFQRHVGGALLFSRITKFFRYSAWKLGGFLSLVRSRMWRIMLTSASQGFMVLLVKRTEKTFENDWGQSRAFLGGVVNAIKFPKECSKGGRLNSGMRRFSKVIED